MKRAITAALISAAAVFSTAGAAYACVPHYALPPLKCTVTITDHLNGKLTTGAYVRTGEIVTVTELLPSGLYGPVSYKITVIRDGVPDVIRLSRIPGGGSLPRSYRGNIAVAACSQQQVGSLA